MIDLKNIIENCHFESQLGEWIDDLARHSGSAIVCSSELTAEQIEKARRTNRILVRPDGIGVALMFGWKRRSKGAA